MMEPTARYQLASNVLLEWRLVSDLQGNHDDVDMNEGDEEWLHRFLDSVRETANSWQLSTEVVDLAEAWVCGALA